MARTDKQEQGQQGEDAALDHLRLHGLALVERNFRCKGGELDLVMRDGAHLVFVEVRRRSSRAFGGAAASITPAKQRRMKIAAQVFLLRYPKLPPCRFDVIAIDGGEIGWLKNVMVDDS
jgi:putative endonuclease